MSHTYIYYTYITHINPICWNNFTCITGADYLWYFKLSRKYNLKVLTKGAMTFGTVFVKSFFTLSKDNASSPDPYACNPTLDSIWMVVTYILMTFGFVVIVENLFIVMVFLVHKEFHLLSNLFVTSLCVADFLYASFGFYGAMALDSTKVSSFSFSKSKSQLCE